ncbi:response regulator transcription factor [Serpentinicella sp. ANB-PHB4]|uniref:response regulator transcription factor n=1 Tax=Serpentinicella sp. ANB-PHB4 TaxID=3074076 RepID=UPI00285D2227|nr:response regulator transcription factor [Serpentinicella sp. ANB-PHB4]MDR5658412.1 response regulator transcription factor [Serpentinicella sp. ANB-PHB4]
MKKILIAEDEQKMRELIKTYLEAEGFNYVAAKDGEEAIEVFKESVFDAVILDVMMPRIDGWSVCREIRKTSDIPIIMLTARGEEYDKLFGFELGVDDYIVKPFSPKELMARLKAVIRRSLKIEESDQLGVMELNELIINTSSRDVYINNKLIKLTPKEYELLVYLVYNKNKALSRQQILNGVWGADFFGDDRTVDTHIKMLRERLQDYKRYITTVWGVGYKFEIGDNNE